MNRQWYTTSPLHSPFLLPVHVHGRPLWACQSCCINYCNCISSWCCHLYISVYICMENDFVLVL